VEDGFTDLDEQADEQRERLRLGMRKGQFSAMRELPDLLIKPILTQAAVLGGKVQGIENAISAYRTQTLEVFNRGRRRLLEPLLSAVGEGPLPPLQAGEGRGLSLHGLIVDLDLRQRQLEQRAVAVLAETGVDLERWCEIAEEMLAGREPGINDQELKALVARGILRQRISFGGDA